MEKFKITNSIKSVCLLVTPEAELHPSVWQQLNERPFPQNVMLFVWHSDNVAHFLSVAENPMYLNVAFKH